MVNGQMPELARGVITAVLVTVTPPAPLPTMGVVLMWRWIAELLHRNTVEAATAAAATGV